MSSSESSFISIDSRRGGGGNKRTAAAAELARFSDSDNSSSEQSVQTDMEVISSDPEIIEIEDHVEDEVGMREGPAAVVVYGNDDDDNGSVEDEEEDGNAEDEDEEEDENGSNNEEEEEDLPEPGPMDDGTYTVEKIVSKRINEETGDLEYEVKWVGWSADTNTFEPIAHLTGSEYKIKEYEARKYREEQRKRRRNRRARFERSVSASGGSEVDVDDEGAGPRRRREAEVNGEEEKEVEKPDEDDTPQRQRAIAREVHELITSTERKIVAVRAIELGCAVQGTRDVFDVLFDDKRCARIPDYKLHLLSEPNYRFIHKYYIRRIDEIAAAKEKAYKRNLALAYSLMPEDFNLAEFEVEDD